MARRARPAGIGRLEAFSDAVLAIVLTLLILDLLPKGAQSPAQLLASWPTYVAYLSAFLMIGIIWINHYQALSRVRSANAVILALNLGVLLGASLLPWPTTLFSSAALQGNATDEIAAIYVFAAATVVLSVPWLCLDLYLAHRPHLLQSAADVKWMYGHARASIWTIVGAAVSIGIAYLSPFASLILYVVFGAGFLGVRLRESSVDNEVDDGIE